MSMEMLHAMNGAACVCGKVHSFSAKVVTGSGVIHQLPGILAELGAKKPFLLSDRNTWKAAGKQVAAILAAAKIAYSSYSLPEEAPKPDEQRVGSAVMHFDHSCDAVIGIGSGVVNDIGKILAATAKLPYIIVGTAPSMDGYASATSSMTRDGLKISLPSKGADVIIGDTDILCKAPEKLLKAGLGDMLAKYVSICEWRIAKVLVGEYYCPQIAQLIRSAVKLCVDGAQGLLKREPQAVQAVFEGLVIGGVAMNYAGISRPASGGEHYLSHLIDMRSVEFGTVEDLHGIQCAIGTLVMLGLYEKLREITPDREKALAYAASFDFADWSAQLRQLLGKGAESMIAQEAKEGKYDVDSHKCRLEVILENWDAILQIMAEELPAAADLEKLLDDIAAPKTLSDIGVDAALLPMLFKASKDIRDKYVLARLAWDLGILEEMAQTLV